MCRATCHTPAVQVAEGFEVSGRCAGNLTGMAAAMRRPGLLLRADEMFPSAVGHVLAVVGLCMHGDQLVGDRSVAQTRRVAVCLLAALVCRVLGRLPAGALVQNGNSLLLVLVLTTKSGLSLPCRTLAWATLPGALHLLRFAGTLAMDPEPNWNALLIDTSALLAVAHLSLLQSHPECLTEVRTNVS